MKIKKQIKGLTKYKRDIIEKVCSLVAEEFSVDEEDLFKKSRAFRYSTPRSVAAGLLRVNYGIQYQILADYFGYVSHSSIIHAVKSVDRKIKTDREMRSIIRNILINVSKEIKPNKEL